MLFQLLVRHPIPCHFVWNYRNVQGKYFTFVEQRILFLILFRKLFGKLSLLEL